MSRGRKYPATSAPLARAPTCTGTGLASATSMESATWSGYFSFSSISKSQRSATAFARPPATSAPGLGSPLPHLHRDWADPPPHDLTALTFRVDPRSAKVAAGLCVARRPFNARAFVAATMPWLPGRLPRGMVSHAAWYATRCAASPSEPPSRCHESSESLAARVQRVRQGSSSRMHRRRPPAPTLVSRSVQPRPRPAADGNTNAPRGACVWPWPGVVGLGRADCKRRAMTSSYRWV
jgi:hypothetical protein